MGNRLTGSSYFIRFAHFICTLCTQQNPHMFKVVVCAFVEKSKVERSHWIKKNRAKKKRKNGFPQEKPGRKQQRV